MQPILLRRAGVIGKARIFPSSSSMAPRVITCAAPAPARAAPPAPRLLLPMLLLLAATATARAYNGL